MNNNINMFLTQERVDLVEEVFPKRLCFESDVTHTFHHHYYSQRPLLFEMSAFQMREIDNPPRRGSSKLVCFVFKIVQSSTGITLYLPIVFRLYSQKSMSNFKPGQKVSYCVAAKGPLFEVVLKAVVPAGKYQKCFITTEDSAMTLRSPNLFGIGAENAYRLQIFGKPYEDGDGATATTTNSKNEFSISFLETQIMSESVIEVRDDNLGILPTTRYAKMTRRKERELRRKEQKKKRKKEQGEEEEPEREGARKEDATRSPKKQKHSVASSSSSSSSSSPSPSASLSQPSISSSASFSFSIPSVQQQQHSHEQPQMQLPTTTTTTTIIGEGAKGSARKEENGSEEEEKLEDGSVVNSSSNRSVSLVSSSSSTVAATLGIFQPHQQQQQKQNSTTAATVVSQLPIPSLLQQPGMSPYPRHRSFLPWLFSPTSSFFNHCNVFHFVQAEHVEFGSSFFSPGMFSNWEEAAAAATKTAPAPAAIPKVLFPNVGSSSRSSNSNSISSSSNSSSSSSGCDDGVRRGGLVHSPTSAFHVVSGSRNS